MANYIAPRANVNVFNPENFLQIASPSVSNKATTDALKADTDAITASATAQQIKFAKITSQPKMNQTISLSGTFNVGATGISLTLPVTLTTDFFYYLTFNLNFIQSGANSGGTVFAISGIQCYNNWTQSYTSWSSLQLSNVIYSNPGFQYSAQAMGNNAQPTLTFYFPVSSGGYTTNPNSFTATGIYSIFGVQVAK
jgi:hypothetical protein